MAIDNFTIQASSVMTVISLTTFIGILWWSFSKRREDDFAEAARIPFEDDFLDAPAAEASESRHV
ncbi:MULTISPECIES: cbb3-type cytochrome c oxidase subunit 3 [unclassified Herbaspirillum]|jgi:cytochrome c oxidase cbb3-type subunit 4|uniref:cbb3-type cytochrome oxidase subunit 3 n=1 Tax=unclassified Herbaspirillum TaxID=2624150 RepID=UPI000E2F8301|nr:MULTISPECIES: cbb3-type cytochrome c oxidase subunit 3 [unclassified Herbaspirillum]RFB73044.1 CcoQ/FixQ family Cbb3-type cytochrome c oxidase assembly chaperone [Herbaspirillum sp. 3R-3a1]TFI11146.1 CcoQ/FixQ family Cbb3-type cytochrome c oxidase assembly chaperone [Herbaspirillum sp. 3R11]TFI17054.1 CcoQ/FixQ family Cbb3-type cytochrome c oxidase assembly chaperone [Herbaspirillum sp. 3R-11]TFI31132.1 CcoQ/FixQ family Cbb3-type cytochrome c oxidase assembly chaperone [Herbaspirillum sp. 3C